MSGEYVPTTETVRAAWFVKRTGLQVSEIGGHGPPEDDATGPVAEFDRWLAQVRAEALREAAVAIRQSSVDLDPGRSDAELSYINCTSMDAEIVLRMADDIARGGRG